MGKGGGFVPSKKKLPEPTTIVHESPPDSTSNTTAGPDPSKNLKLFIVFYSMYGHVEGLARRVGSLFFIDFYSPPKDDSIPVIGSPADLVSADGFLFGFPTRYGCMAAQMEAFFDSTGQFWREQKLFGKPAGFFVSTGTQGGGQETTVTWY